MISQTPGQDSAIRYSVRHVAHLALLLLVVVFFLGLCATPARAASWMDPYLDQVVEWGVMRGDTSGNLNPDRRITRAEFVTMINRAFGHKEAGTIPFKDVPSNAWYAEDIAIAYRAGYFTGTSSTTASPNALVTREQAVAMLGRNLRMQTGTGSILSYTDSNQMATWSRGMIQEATDMGIITGYSDGSFRPKTPITRGQAACILARALGTLIQEPGEQTAGGVYGNLTINTPGVTLRDTVVTGNLYLSGGVDLEALTLENVRVMGKIVVCGAGASQKGDSSIILRNVKAEGLEIDSMTNQFMSIQADGLTDIKETIVRTPAYLEDLTDDDLGFQFIKLEGANGTQLQLTGNIKEVLNRTPGSTMTFGQGVADKVTVDERATGSTVTIDKSANLRELNLDTGTTVTGSGDISILTVNSDGSVVSMLPDTITVRPGSTANIDKTKMDSAAAAESSEDPRILAGYPAAKNVGPKAADIVFSTNKSGTLYWGLTALSDGSLDEEDLLSSSKSAKVIKSGTLKVSASKTEMTTKLSGLTVDGSYYVSAILEDSRGRLSPVKVTAFTTPDDTTPNFSTGYPYSILTSDGDQQIIQAMVMPTKDCQLYYALLPKGSTAPKAADFKAAAVTGNLGYGVMDVKKNTQHLIPKVNTSYLAEQTSYDLYLWLNDADNGKSSAVKKLTVTTLDKTAPVIQHLTVTDVAAKSVTLTYSLDEPGTLYWAVAKRGTQFYALGIEGPEEQMAKIQVETGTGALKKGSSNASKGSTDVKFTVSGLEPQTAYDLYFVAKDKAGNYNVYTTNLTPPMEINTLDNDAPTVTQEFTHDGTDNPKSPTPYPDTSIRLVFSESVQGIQNVGGQQVVSNFHELYQAVASAKTSESRAKAEDALADALRSHITLFYKPANGTPEPVPERTSSSGSGADWIIDYRKANVTLDPSGSGEMIITFPYNSDLEQSGLNLLSGATYYFELQGIADTSTAANRMEGVRGVTKLPEFTTIDAQLVFSRNTATSPDNPNVLFDMTFQLTPVTTSSVSDETMWDLLFWSDSTIEFSLYAKEKDGTWSQIGGNGKTAKIQTTPAAPNIGVSITQQLIGPDRNPSFEQLKDMTKSREYGIVIEKIDNSDKRSEWSAPVSIKIVPIAGPAGALTEMSQLTLTPETYAAQQSGIDRVKEIGVPAEYTVTHTFRDSAAPSFVSGYPTFDTGDEGVNIDVMLNRGNTYYYYVIAPLNKIQTVYDGTTINSVPTWEKLPESGLYDDGTPVTDTEVTLPSSNDIMNPRYSGTEYKSGYGKYSAGVPRISIDGLNADTEYIAYFVLKGESQDSYSGVYAFRFKTAEVTRPVLTISIFNPSATIQSDREADVSYMLLVAGKQGEPFNKKLSDGYLDQDAVKTYSEYWKSSWGNLTVLDAMKESVTQGNKDIGSVFDFFANKTAKDAVTNAVLYGGTSSSTIATSGNVSLTQRNNLTFTNNFSKNMSVGTSYWIVAVGKSPLGSGYAYRSNAYLSTVDTQHPMVVSLNTEVPSQVYASELEARQATYRGTVYITFDEDLYYMQGTEKWSPVTNQFPAPDGYVHSSSLLESHNASVAASTSGSNHCNSLTLTFKNIGPNNSIRLTSSIADSSGNNGMADGTLVLNLEIVKVGNYWTAQFVIAPGSSGWNATK